MSFANLSFPIENPEIPLLMKEIDDLESKKQEILRNLSLYSLGLNSRQSEKEHNKSFTMQSLRRGLKGMSKENKNSNELMGYQGKNEAAGKPSHLYMALAKYLFYDQNNTQTELKEKEEDTLPKEVMDFISNPIFKNQSKKNFDCESFASSSTKDNLSVSNSLEPTLNEHLWTPSNQKEILWKYASELDFDKDWDKISEKTKGSLSQKKSTHKITKEPLPNKAFKRARSRFNSSEDQKIISLLVKIGQNWKEIAKNLPGRTEAMIKNRYYSHIKKKHFSLFSNKNNNNSFCEENNIKKEFCLDFEDMVKEMGGETALLHKEHVVEEKNQVIPAEFNIFQEDSMNEVIKVEEEIAWDLMKTPDISYNFEDYRCNNLLKFTPVQPDFVKEEENLESSSFSDESFCITSDHGKFGQKKMQIKDLSNKIGDIEVLLQQTKKQINKLCGFN